MFLIFKYARPAGNKKHATYEAARQAVRKLLRKQVFNRYQGQPDMPMAFLGYEIRKV